MRILYLTNSNVPSTAANSVQVMKMCQALARAGHDVELSCRAGLVDAEPFEYYGIDPIFRLTRSPHVAASKLTAVRDTARRTAAALTARNRLDLIVSRSPRLLLGAAASGADLVVEMHGVPLERHARVILELLFAHPRLVGVVCISQALADDMQLVFPSLSSNKIVVLHDAADPIVFDTPLTDAELGGRPEAVKVGYVGSLFYGRGVDIVVAAAARMPELDFHIVGGNPEIIAEWRGRVEGTNVIFHGHVPHTHLSSYYARFDILLAPYQEKVGVFNQGRAGGAGDIGRWMSPMKVFEYMSSGRPMVCSDRPVLREVLTPGVTAMMPPPGDVDAWVTSIRALAEDATLRQRIADAAKARLIEEYTWEARAAHVTALARPRHAAQ